MKKMKLFGFSIIAIIFLSSLVACSENTNEKENNIDEQKQEQINKDLPSVNNENTKSSNFDLGKKIFKEKCLVCHQADGKGVEGTFPPLAGSDYLLADKDRAILQTIQGSKTPITVNGIEYPGNIMTVFELSDKEITEVVNYVLNSWGNQGGTITIKEVKAVRAKIK